MTHHDDALDNLMNEVFADARPDAGFEDRLVAGFRHARRLPTMVLHPMVRRAAVGVAAAILLGGVGFTVTRLPQQRIKDASNLKDIDISGGTQLAFDVKNGRSIESPRGLARQLAQGWSKKEVPSDEWKRTNTHGVEGGTHYWDVQKQIEDRTKASQFNDYDSHASKTAPRSTAGRKSIEELGLEKSGPVSAPAEAAAEPHAIQDLSQVKALSGVNSFGNQTFNYQGGSSVRHDYYGDDFTVNGGIVVAGKEAASKSKSRELGTNATANGEGRISARGSVVAPSVVPGAKSGVTNGTFRPSEIQKLAKNVAPYDQFDTVAVPTDGPQPVELLAGKLSEQESKVDAKRATSKSEGQLALGDKPAGGQQGTQGQQQGGQGQGQAPAAPKNSAPAKGAAQQTATDPAPAPRESDQLSRKIIRNGDMTFEVDSYDSSVLQITKIAAEEGGFVATTESEKLPNGKVKGSVVVRVPPERLDTLVLKLRGLGDLKNSRIAAQDVTKLYTDIDSQLRAAHAMETRLLDIIKNGQGNVKDLLEAEKQLGTWREKIEKLEGEIRYYNNLISLSTLNITLAERDIRTAALLTENEQVNMGVEAEDVEKARAAAIKAIDEAKGRIVESNLKKHDAGQFSATIVADVSPDASGPTIDRLKQLGRVARLEVQRRQSTGEGTGAPAPGARVERKDTRLMLSIYNLANVAARNSTSLHLASDDVEKAYLAVLDQIKSAGGRVTSSQLTKPTPEQTTGTITFESPSAAADVLLGSVRGVGDVMRLETSINPDTQNVTDAKRGFSVQIRSLATVPPRESTVLRVASRDVADSFSKLRNFVRDSGGRILTSQLAQQDKNNVTGQLDFEVKRDNLAAAEAALAEAGAVLSRNVNRSADAQNTVDSKVLLQVAFADERTVPPREAVTLQLAVDDVSSKYDKLIEALRGAGARITNSQINQQNANNTTASLEIDAHRETRAAVEKALAEAGGIYGRLLSRPGEGQAVLEDKVHFSVTLNDIDNLAPRETTTIGIETNDVAKAAADLENDAVLLGGRKIDSDWAQDPGGQTIARVLVDVPLAKADELLAKVRGSGRVLSVQRDRMPNAPEGSFARARLSATIATAGPIQGDQSLGGSIRSGLSVSVQWLLKSVSWIVIGLCLVAPWVLILWVGWKLIRRRKALSISTTSATA